MNLPNSARGGAVFLCRDIGRPAARELRDADGGARSAESRGRRNTGCGRRRGRIRYATSGTPPDDRAAD